MCRLAPERVMTGQGSAPLYAVVLTGLGYPLGLWMARVYTAERLPGASLERGFLRLSAADASRTGRATGRRCSSSAPPSSACSM